ncbi:phosphotransferase [Actinomadura sp. 6N118]|uniref:phosphotransferase n=1 Tax=Actinomadura sp. 6N118 TaxID=3375151 RepID=UPI00379BF01B
MRIDWTELPAEIRVAIEDHTGTITDVRPASEGNHANIASTVSGPHGSVFVKAARKVATDQNGPEVRSLRWESAINPHVSEFTPQLVGTAEAGGWLALIFEQVDGRHADFSPESPDLAVLTEVVNALQRTPAPDALKKYVERRWESVVQDVSPIAGDCLIHADLNPANFLITPGRVYLVDWAFVARGTAWVEPALLMPWLLRAGHEPAEAEKWLLRFASWADAEPDHLDLFAGAFAAKWKINLKTSSEPWAVQHARAAQTWADYRLG